MQVLKIIHKGYPRLCHCTHGVVLARAFFFSETLAFTIDSRSIGESIATSKKNIYQFQWVTFILYFEKH